MEKAVKHSAGSYDVLVVGAGVIGLSIARELHKRGVSRIAVVDRGEAGKEASFAAAGMLSPHAEADREDEFYRFCAESFGLYDTFAAELFDETGIDIELDRKGALYISFDDQRSAEIDRRFEWQARAATGVCRLSRAEILALEPCVSPAVMDGLFFPNDWQVENRKLLAALRRYADLNGISIIENCRIDRLMVTNGRVSGAVAGDGNMTAEHTVLATGAWTSLIEIGERPFPVRVEPVKGQMICFAARPGMLKKVIFGPNGYLVPRKDGRILAGATVEHAGFDKEVNAETIASLHSAALEIAPALRNFKIVDSWAGLRPMVSDGLPVIGDVSGITGLHVATAHFRNGILLAPLTAAIVASAVTGDERSEYLRYFGAARFGISAGTR
ncbi:MAG TPA: glycine oxidase ThiO, partial [Pyrinomonadaceae bacterium]|nr:glycine oxidase ThiO [Pyrinomonadaceae bacterium]